MRGVLSAIETNQIRSYQLGVGYVVDALRGCVDTLPSKCHRLPVFLLVDEVSKIGSENMRALVIAVNQMLGRLFYAVWTSLAVGHFEKNAWAPSNREVVPLYLHGLDTQDCEEILRKELGSQIDAMAPRLFKRGANDADMPCSPADILEALASLAGGNPRFVECIILKINCSAKPLSESLNKIDC